MSLKELECNCKGNLPARLHVNGRETVEEIEKDDFFYMRYPATGSGVNGFKFLVKVPAKTIIQEHDKISGHDHLEDQSVNSKLLNTPDGKCSDVLLDPTTGEPRPGWGAVAIAHQSILEFEFEDPSQLKKVAESRTPPTEPVDRYTFKVRHDPTTCMYPHCVIELYRGDKLITDLKNKTVQTYIRTEFSKYACKYAELVDELLVCELGTSHSTPC